MSDITLEKIDIIRERTNISYSEAKEALVTCNGDLVETFIYLEERYQSSRRDKVSEFNTNKEEFKAWIKDTIRKGNVSRIKIRNSTTDKVIVDIPVNAGIAAGLFAMMSPMLLPLGFATAVVTRVTIEITKNDGSIEVVNKVIKNVLKDINEKIIDIKGKAKIDEVKSDKPIEFVVKKEKKHEDQ